MKRNLPETDTNGASPEQSQEHPAAQKKTDMLLDLIRDGRPMTLRQQLRLTVGLSVPAIIAQLSSIIMQYIDAAMVGRIGAEASASIGLVSTTTWLFWGLCTAAATGFSVQVAHKVGAGDLKGARMILLQSLVGTLVFSLLLAVLGAGISSSLPAWLGGDISIRRDASIYFFIFSIFLPVLQMIFLAGGMLRCSGNMRIPSLLGVIMCVLDVVFNFFLIFPTRGCSIAGMQFTILGAGLGVSGAALGTAAAETVVAGVLLWYLLTRSEKLSYRSREGSFRLKADTFRKALRIGFPMGITYSHLRCPDFDDCHRSATRSLCHCSQFFCHYGRKSLLYARLRNCGCGHHSCWPEHRSRTEEADPQLCPYYRTDGNGHHGHNGYPYVSVRPSDYRDDDSGRRNPSAGGNGFTHRSFC